MRSICGCSIAFYLEMGSGLRIMSLGVCVCVRAGVYLHFYAFAAYVWYNGQLFQIFQSVGQM